MKFRHRWLGVLFIAVATGLAVVSAACATAEGSPSGVVLAAGATPSASAAASATASPAASAAASATPVPYTATVGAATATATPSSDPPTQAPTSSPTASPTPCNDTAGRFTSVDVPSTILTYDINTRIYLPPCYASSGKSYPVLYLIHGLNSTEDQWERLGIGQAADRLAAAGQIAPLIMVLPRERGDLAFDPALVMDLVPYVDSHYRTLASAGYRAIGGMSRGGGWAIHLGLRYSGVFGRVGAHSPAIFYGDENNVLNYLRAVAKSGGAPALYIDDGAADAEPQSAEWLDQMLTAYKIAHTYVRPPGGHFDNYWEAHLDDYLRFYAANWRPAPPPTATPVPSPTQRF